MSQYSAEQAAEIHCALTVQTFQTLQQSNADQVELHIAGDLQHHFFRQALFAQAALKPQVSGDLGDKMRQALNNSLEQYQYCLLVGSDCPALTTTVLEQAFLALEGLALEGNGQQPGTDLVLIPAEDGGYVLIGCRCPLPDNVFEGIDWGESTVLAQTLANLKQQHLSYTLLPTLWDVDHPEDVVRWQQEGGNNKPVTSALEKTPDHSREDRLN